MKKLGLLLTSFFAFSSNPSDDVDWKLIPAESQVGIHITLDIEGNNQILSSSITDKNIENAIENVDWDTGFHLITVVVEPGVSMEVGGSLDPEHGLSAMYRNRHERIEAVIVDPPSTPAEMKDILLTFIHRRDAWPNKYQFNFYPY